MRGTRGRDASRLRGRDRCLFARPKLWGPGIAFQMNHSGLILIERRSFTQANGNSEGTEGAVSAWRATKGSPG